MGKRCVVLLLCVLLPMAQVNLSVLCECFHKVVCMNVCCVLCVVCMGYIVCVERGVDNKCCHEIPFCSHLC